MRVIQARSRLYCVMLVLLLLVSAFMGGRYIPSAFADTGQYSSVLADLQKDGNFNADDYPENSSDNSIQVIQVAESIDGELLIYTYQPCQKLVYIIANEINMSFSESVDGTKLYGLTLVKSDGVFCKYVVDGVTVSNETVRYYNISSIYRPYDSVLDATTSNGYMSVAFPVGQVWTATTNNGTVEYTNQSIDFITITGCDYGSVRVPEGFNWWLSSSCDLHFIAFSTNIKMDNLLEADVDFKYRSVSDGIYDNDEVYGAWQSKTVTVNYREYGTSDGRIFGSGGTRTWDRIQTSSAFLDSLSKNGISTDSSLSNDISKNEWVLAFYETKYVNSNGGVFGWLGYVGSVFGYNNVDYVEVSDATIIRLEFIKDNVHYNLGAVSNRTDVFQTVAGDNYSFGDWVADTMFFPISWLADKLGIPEWSVWLILGLLVLFIGLPILGMIFPALGNVLLTILKGIWWVICLPFRGIKALIEKAKDKGTE